MAASHLLCSTLCSRMCYCFQHFMHSRKYSTQYLSILCEERGNQRIYSQSTTTTNSRTLWHCRERTLFPQHGLQKKMLCHTPFFVIYNSICTKQQTSYELVHIQNNFHLSTKFCFLLIFHINKDCMLNNYRNLSLSIKMFA